MRSFTLAALVGTVTAAPATVFLAGDVPKCYVLANGETKVEYTNSDIHPSFKCTHTGNACKCTNPHPTHHVSSWSCPRAPVRRHATLTRCPPAAPPAPPCAQTGRCMELDHSSGKTHSFSGDCSAGGLNAIDGGVTGFGACNSAGYKYRTCTNPSPAHGGKGCADALSATCPRNGGWGGWGGWGGCSKTCGPAGRKYRYRSCNNPTAINGGSGCAGGNHQIGSCNTQSCATYHWLTGPEQKHGGDGKPGRRCADYGWSEISSEDECKQASSWLQARGTLPTPQNAALFRLGWNTAAACYTHMNGPLVSYLAWSGRTSGTTGRVGQNDYIPICRA